MDEKICNKRYWIDLKLLEEFWEPAISYAQDRIIKYAELENPVIKDMIDCKNAESELDILAKLMDWCNNFKISSEKVEEIITKEKDNNIT